MPDTFCALPFQSLCLGVEGTARICCATTDFVTEHGAPMSLNTHSMDEIWNSAYMRNVRRSMLAGERIPACTVCYENEAARGHSYRTNVGSQPVPGQPARRTEMSRYGRAAGYRVDDRPGFLKLEISNLCNLKCRMCYGGNSSQIERDPVHGRWNGGVEPLHAIWRGEWARIGPEPRIGVRSSGLHPPEYLEDGVRCWTDGHAIFNVPLQAGTRPTQLDITFHPSGVRGQDFQIIVNGRPKTKGLLQCADAPVSIDLQGMDNPGELTIEIMSNRIVETAGGPEQGTPLSLLLLRREWIASSNNAHPQVVSPRLALDAPWYMDDRKIFDDVLRSAGTLRRLCITGGEPLINDRVADMLDLLIARGEAPHIYLEMSTNCTRVDLETVDRLKKFGNLQLYFSLDGYGDTYEYIRYPARWKAVEANVRTLKETLGSSCFVTPVVQIYNVLRLTDLYQFCDAMDLPVIEDVLKWPERLAIRNLPPKARKAAAAKLFEYCETGCGTVDKTSRLAIARYLDQLNTPGEADLIREMMVFTNDLDVTRGQSFRATYPDLVRLLAEDGLEWIDDTRYARDGSRTRPARERDYAWL